MKKKEENKNLNKKKRKKTRPRKKQVLRSYFFFYKFLPQISLFAYERKLVEQDETSLIFRRGLKENYAAHLKDFFCLRADYHFINAHLNY